MAKKKQSKASWRKRGASIEEALRVAREGADQDRRTGGALGSVKSERLFSLDTKPGKGGREQKLSRRERREAQPPLHVDTVVAGNPHIKPISEPRPKPAKKRQREAEPGAAAPAAAAPARPAKRSKAGKIKAPKPVPVLPAPGPAGQLPRTSLGGLSDVWAEGGCAEGGAEGGPSLRRRPARAGPSSLHAPEPTGKASVPRVRVPSEGASFNPPAEAHAPLLAAAVGHELERERREERPAWRLEREAIEAAARRALVDQASTTSLPLREGSGEGDEGSGGEEEEEEAGVPIVRRAVSDRKKTAAQLNRSRRAREREQEAAAAREQRKREVQLGRLGPILSQLSKEERGRERRREAAEERESARRKRLGKLKYEERRPEVLLSEELGSSLRALPRPAEVDLLADRFDSFKERNLVEVRKRAGKPRRARRQEVTKESHRDRRYNAAGQPLGFDKSPAPVWV